MSNIAPEPRYPVRIVIGMDLRAAMLLEGGMRSGASSSSPSKLSMREIRNYGIDARWHDAPH